MIAPVLPILHHSLALDLEPPQQGKKCKLELYLNGAMIAYKDGASDFYKCTGLTCFSTPLLRGKTLNKEE